MTTSSSYPHEERSFSPAQPSPPEPDPSSKRVTVDAGYVSARSADALLSDIRPTSLEPQALIFLNELLDELLGTILKRSHGLSTERIKTLAVPYVIPLPLSRESISEAELELLSWTESEEGRVWQGTKEKIYASDDVDDVGQKWPHKEAWDLMRAITQTYSTFGDRQKNDRSIAGYMKAMESKGGDVREGIVESAALYLTAIIEYIAENVLASLSRVMVNDRMLSRASPKELYAALSHNEFLYEMMKRMKIKKTIESHLASKLRSPPNMSRMNSQGYPVAGSAEAAQRGNQSSSTTALVDSTSSGAQFDTVNSNSSRKTTEPAANSVTSKFFFKGSRPSADLNASSVSLGGVVGAPKGSLGKKSGTYIRGVGEDATLSNPSSKFSSGSAIHDGVVDEDEQQVLAKQDQFDKLIQGENTKKMTLTPHALLRNSEDNVDYRLFKTRNSASRSGSQQNHQRSASANGNGPISSESRSTAPGRPLDRVDIDEEEVLNNEPDPRPTHRQQHSVMTTAEEQQVKNSFPTYPSSDLIGLFNQPSSVTLDSEPVQSKNDSGSPRTTNVVPNEHAETGKGKKSGGLKGFVSRVMGNSSKESQDSNSSDRPPRSSVTIVHPGPYTRTPKANVKDSTDNIKTEKSHALSGSPSPVGVNPSSGNREQSTSDIPIVRSIDQSLPTGQSSSHAVDSQQMRSAVSDQSLSVSNKSFRFDRVPAPSAFSDPPSPRSNPIALSRSVEELDPVSTTNNETTREESNSSMKPKIELNPGRVIGLDSDPVSLESASVQPSPQTIDLNPSSLQSSPAQTPPSSIPLTELAQLREILTYASTADECRILVNALLGSWKVPHVSVNSSFKGGDRVSPREMKAHMVEQIGQAYEWYLDGEKSLKAVSS